jgi:hypothetical protein
MRKRDGLVALIALAATGVLLWLLGVFVVFWRVGDALPLTVSDCISKSSRATLTEYVSILDYTVNGRGLPACISKVASEGMLSRFARSDCNRFKGAINYLWGTEVWDSGKWRGNGGMYAPLGNPSWGLSAIAIGQRNAYRGLLPLRLSGDSSFGNHSRWITRDSLYVDHQPGSLYLSESSNLTPNDNERCERYYYRSKGQIELTAPSRRFWSGVVLGGLGMASWWIALKRDGWLGCLLCLVLTYICGIASLILIGSVAY